MKEVDTFDICERLSYKKYVFVHSYVWSFSGLFGLHPQFLKTLQTLQGDMGVLPC